MARQVLWDLVYIRDLIPILSGACMPQRSWQQLCEAIMRERDPKRLLALVEELNHTLQRREDELAYTEPLEED